MIDRETGIPSLKVYRAVGQRSSATRLEQQIKARMLERSVRGIAARSAYVGAVVAPFRPVVR